MKEEITVTVLNGEVVIWPTNGPEPGRLELRDEMVVTIASCELAGPEQGQAFVWKVDED